METELASETCFFKIWEMDKVPRKEDFFS